MASRLVEEFVLWRHPYQWIWADAAAKSAQSVTASGLYKRGLQVDTLTEYFLTSVSPVVWTAAGGSGGGSGTVTSVSMTVPSMFALAGSPITTSGTLALTLSAQSANTFLSGPTTGAAATPTFRALALADIPSGVLLSANNLSDLANAGTARANLGLTIGTNVQAYNANLAALSGLTGAADTGLYFTGAGAAATYSLSSFARTFSGSANAAAGRSALGVVIGTDVQAYDADLATIAGLTATTDSFLQAKSSAWTTRTPAQVTADLSVAVGDSGSGGTKGLVPAPAAGDAAAGKFLKADMTYAVPSGGGGAGCIVIFPTDGSTAASTTTWNQAFYKNPLAAANEGRNRTYLPLGGTISKMKLWVNQSGNAQPASGSLVITLYKNGAATALTITIAASATVTTVQVDNTNTVTVSEADYLHLVIQNNATATSVNISNVTMKLA